MNYFNIIWSNLSEFKQKSFIFLIMLLTSSFFEILSVGAIYQVLIILSEPQTNKNFFFEKFNIFNENYISFILLTLVFIFIFKNLLNIYFINWQQKFLNIFDVYLSDKLFRYYLNKDYQEFSKKNSSHYVRNLTYEISNYKGALQDLMTLVVEIILFIFILIFLFYINLFGTLLICSIFILFGLLYFFGPLNQIIKSWSKRRLFFSNKYTKYLIQGLNSVKEIRVYQSEDEASKDHFENKKSVNDLIKKLVVLNVIPKNFFEIIIIVLLSIYVLAFVNLEKKLIELIPLLGVYLAAAYKMLPSIIKVINSINSLKFSSASITHINNEIKSANKLKKNEGKDEISLNKFNEMVFKNVSFKYKNSNKWILRNSSLKIKKGEFVGISGESGKGKSTIINLMLGLLNPSKGKIYINKKNLNVQKKNWLKIISYVPQNIFITDSNIYKNIGFGNKISNIDKKRVKKILKNLKVYSEIKSKGFQKNLGERGNFFSGGQSQRIVLGRAFYKDPDLIFFDEATNGLDKKNEKNIFKIILKMKKKKTFIISSHSEELLNLCDYVIEIKNGSLIKKKNND